MEDKITFVRNHILGMLERGELKGGDKLPGARELMPGEKISLPTVQSAIEILVHEGVLETFPRRGTFVQKAWRSRILQQNLVLFRPRLEWLDDLWQLARREVPEVWISDKFTEGVFELRTTQYVQAYHNQHTGHGSFQPEHHHVPFASEPHPSIRYSFQPQVSFGHF